MEQTTYFAQLDKDNIVTAVAVVERAFLDANPERYPGRWVETFFNLPNKTYAGVGCTYDENTHDFIPVDKP